MISEPLLKNLEADNKRASQRMTRFLISMIMPTYLISTALLIGFSKAFIFEFSLIWIFGTYFCVFAFTIDHLAHGFRRLRDQGRIEELLLMPYTIPDILKTYVIYHIRTQSWIIIPSAIIQIVVITIYFVKHGFANKYDWDLFFVMLIALLSLLLTSLIAMRCFVYQIIDSIVTVGVQPHRILNSFFHIAFITFSVFVFLNGLSLLLFLYNFDFDDLALMGVYGMIFSTVLIYRMYKYLKGKILDSWDNLTPEVILESLSKKADQI